MTKFNLYGKAFAIIMNKITAKKVNEPNWMGGLKLNNTKAEGNRIFLMSEMNGNAVTQSSLMPKFSSSYNE